MPATPSVSRNSGSPTSTRPNSGVFFSRRFFSVSAFVLVAGGSATLGVLARVPEGRIAPHVRVAGLALGGKSQDEARSALETHLERYAKTPITLQFPAETGIKRVWRTSARQLGLRVDTDATLQAAGNVAPPGVVQRVASFVSPGKPQDIAPIADADTKKLRVVLYQIGLTVKQKPRNARLIVKKGGFYINRDKPGFEMDLNASAEAVQSAWKQYLLAATTSEAPATEEPKAEAPTESPNTETPVTPMETPAKSDVVETTLVGKITPAAVTGEALKEIDGMLAAFSTYFGGTGQNRGSNIALAAGKINGTVLAPGQVFSYNETVGPRIASEGFQLAPVIVNNQLVPGIGGGICQVSSTLYNAVLFADMKIVRRSHHTFPVHYVPAGRDATVAYGSLDFQFQNTMDTPVYLSASSKGGKLTFRIYGKKTPGKKVNLTTSGGWNGRGGRTAVLYRTVSENGQVVRRERIASDSYNPPPAKRSAAPKRRTASAARPKKKPAAAASTAPAANTGAPPAPDPNAIP